MGRLLLLSVLGATVPPQAVAILAYLGGGFALWKGIHWLSQGAEQALAPEKRDAIAQMLLDAKPAQRGKAWIAIWLHLFDRVFTTRHLSLSCLIRSFAASIISVLFLSAVYATI